MKKNVLQIQKTERVKLAGYILKIMNRLIMGVSIFLQDKDIMRIAKGGKQNE